MQLFNVTVFRTSTRVATIPVEAESQEEADRKAIDQAGDYDFPGEKSASYFTDKHFVARLNTAAASAYLGGEPYAEYIKLLTASENGYGDHEAREWAILKSSIQNITVDTLIGMIENLSDTIRFQISDHN